MSSTQNIPSNLKPWGQLILQNPNINPTLPKEITLIKDCYLIGRNPICDM